MDDSQQKMQELLDMMHTTVTTLKEENDRLKAERSKATTQATTGGGGPSRSGSGNGSDYRPKKPERPTVNTDIDDREWAIFTDSWTRYKRMIRLQDTDVDNIRLELRECCSTDVNKFLFEYVGPTKLNQCTETELLAHIKSIAVKVVHKEVHRMEFHSLIQDQGEPVTQWVARLRAKAFLCGFEIPCTSCTPHQTISYAEEEISQRLIAGLCNQEHQRRVLSEASSLTTLDLKIKRLQVLETTEKSAQSLQRPPPHQPSTSEAAAAGNKMSLYKSGKNPPKAKEEPGKCRGCGSTPHGGGKKNCPAAKKVCFRCQKKGHFGRVCESAEAAAVDDGETDGDVEHIQPCDASVSFSFGVEATNEQDFRVANRTRKKR